MTPKEAVEKNIAKYSYKFSCSRYGRLGPDGGKVYLEELGTQTIQYTLRARKSSDVDIERVIVLPTPHTIFSVSCTKKVNRKLIIDTTLTKAHIEHPIDESKTIIKIKDLSNGQTYKIIGEGDSINTNYIKTLKYKDGKLPTTIKKTGDYEITVTKQDTRGKTSTQKQTITIKEDLRPIAEFNSC
ncbi:hypothetical protein [Caldisalinibacter kiritimatiensis]|uniref:Uncharacterized protein n=1 Tax=Caldisalinibacter kiritimatiensis TaxID=1304284 RepID=R1CXV5_9FIRM|nr:hypothetical protein [Caldisalinibacter kiritimatiensis]EOD01429.1 hypothetical protein L21TH_0476 [Caldisalinibacter kiritimatiensis]